MIIGIAILFVVLIPVFILGALVVATLWSVVALVSESRWARPSPMRNTRPAARRIAPAGRAAARGVS